MKCQHSRVLVMPADCRDPWYQMYDGKETYGASRTVILDRFRKGQPDETKSLWVADFSMETVRITSPDRIDWEGFNGGAK